jgi:arylsulfatase A-like enzyme
VRDKFGAGFRVSPEDHRRAIAAYLACVSFVDEQIGRLLDALDEVGRAEDTLVVLTSDHGYHLGEHGLWFKNFLYRESTRVPLILCDPRRPETHGRTSDALVTNTDVYPTVMELAGLPMPHEPEGVSLVPLLEGRAERVREAVFAQCHGGLSRDWEGRSIRTDAWAYNEWNGGEAGRELYDLAADPGEHVNLLAGGASHPAAEDLAARLRAGPEGALLAD